MQIKTPEQQQRRTHGLVLWCVGDDDYLLGVIVRHVGMTDIFAYSRCYLNQKKYKQRPSEDLEQWRLRLQHYAERKKMFDKGFEEGANCTLDDIIYELWLIDASNPVQFERKLRISVGNAKADRIINRIRMYPQSIRATKRTEDQAYAALFEHFIRSAQKAG